MVAVETAVCSTVAVEGCTSYWVLGLTEGEARLVADWAARWECTTAQALERLLALASDQDPAELP